MQGQCITNYIHIMVAHMAYWFEEHGNLYKFNQQGWEALNQLLHQFYFGNTNHGGSCGNKMNDNEPVKGEHCRPLMRLCQRRIMWQLGYGQAFFESGGELDPEGPNAI